MVASDTAPPPPSSATSSRVSRDTVEKAVNALFKWKESNSKTQKLQLLPQDNFIYLNITLKKIPQKARINPFKIPIPHPLHDPSSELCLIIDDRPNSNLTSNDAKKIIKSLNIPISKVIKFTKLKTDYKPFEAKRKLCNSYDMFFVDRRIVPLLPRLLGKHFFRDKKLPLPVTLTHKNWKEQIEQVCSSGLVFIGTGTCSVVKIGRGSMEIGEIVDNVVAAIDGIAEVVPKGWGGVRSLHLKFSDSLALPVYQVLPDIKLKIEGIRRNEEENKKKIGGDMEVGKNDEGLEKKSKKKKRIKGRIHEVQYMDASTGGDELGNDEDGDEKSEANDLGGSEFVEKKRKKGQVLSELNGEKMKKKMGEVKKSGNDDDDDVVSTEIEGKKIEKGDTKKRNGVDQKEDEFDLKGGKESGGKKKIKGRIHEVQYMDTNTGEDQLGSDEDDDLGIDEFVEKKRKKGGSVKGHVLSELNGEKMKKKMGKLKKSGNDDVVSAEIEGKNRKKGDTKKRNGVNQKEDEFDLKESGGKKKIKGRIHEVQYMDTNTGEDELGSDDDLGIDEFVEMKRKKGGSVKEHVLSELNGEKMKKKMGKVKKSDNDDVVSAEIEGKKSKKGDTEKRIGKVENGNGVKQKKDGFDLMKGGEESGGQKQHEFGTKLKAGTSKNVKKSKKRRSLD